MNLAGLTRILRAALAGTVGAVVDLLVLLGLAVGLRWPAGLATLVAAASGAAVNFFAARTWAFRATNRPILPQGGFFALSTSIWIALSAIAVHTLVLVMRAPLVVARLGTDLALFLVWGYPVQRWIFKR